MGTIAILILVLTFLILLILGVPIAISIAVAGVATMLVSIDSLPAFTTFAHRMASGLDSFTLLAIPFFVLAGNIMNKGGIALRLVDFARALVGHMTGGLAFVNVMANMLFGAISGSAAAAASAIGSIMGPEMEKEGYSPEFSTAVNVSSATTGLSIPPSNVLIVYSLASGGASITALFIAGYIPGIMTGLAIMLTAMSILIYKTDGIKAVILALAKFFMYLLILIGILYMIFANITHPTMKYGALFLLVISPGILVFIKDKSKFFDILQKFLRAIPSLMMLVIVIGGIVSGIFTATEASAIAVFYAFILALIYGEMKAGDMFDVTIHSVKTTAIVLFLVSASMGLSWIMAYEYIPQTISESLMGFSDNPIVILLIINVTLLAVGIFMDMTPAILIFTPIFLPIVTEQLGLSPIHFGIILILNLSIGLCTPPVGSVLFIGCSVAKVKIENVIKPLIPIYIAMIFVLLLVSYIPQISLWFPGLFDLL